MEPQDHSLQITLPSSLYQLLSQKAQELGQSDGDTIELALRSWLDPDGSANLALLEKRLEQLIDRRIAALRSEFFDVSETKPPRQKSQVPPFHVVRALKVGDLVQVRESGSPYYLEKLSLIRVGIIRAYVATREGERSFLKRDLRLVEPQPE